ncbi:MAG: flagellar basal body rod protein FlgC [Alphaproteobacteria bacterium]|nr:MAG: flagellar basal body rod protein FlgC [Alphaproteobacteria bacterium]
MAPMRQAAYGLKAQGQRLRVIAENMANADTTADTPGGTPYQRQISTFRNVLDRVSGMRHVEFGGVRTDTTDFQKRYQPGHPAADKDGYVLMPNVQPLVEMMDMREAQRSYEANLNIVDAVKQVVRQTLDVLRG